MKARPPRELQIPFDRITYREGQVLASRDLQDDFQANQRLRRMHTRFLHDTWGIGLGFSVDAEIGSNTVHIGPGYAIDNAAREILLANDVALPVPVITTPTDLMIVIGYQLDSAYTGLPNLAVLCAGTTLDPRDERPVFNWRTPDTSNLGQDVPLAHIRVEKGAVTMTPDLSVRTYAARMIRPHTASGSVDFLLDQSELFGIQVDTSDSGFVNTPQYFVRLDATGGTGAFELVAQFLANSAYISSATAKRFTYVIPGLAGLLDTAAVFDASFTINWVGIEPVAGCEPVSNPFRLFSTSGFLMFASGQSKLTQEVIR